VTSDDDRSGHNRTVAHGDPIAPAGFPEMIDAMRDLQDRITAAAPPAGVVAQATATLTALSACLDRFRLLESEQITGRLTDLPGRAQTMIPVVHVGSADDNNFSGSVTYGRFYLGGNGAVHGGAVSLLFDDVLGRLATAGSHPYSRTAYLHVDYRSITPVERELRIEARLERVEGRKRYVRGTLSDGDRLCAEADGLFVTLRPGQP
jgi:acyl-coenzyme A thioesterase PaaI-like protein